MPIVAQAVRPIDWRNPGEEGGLWVALLRNLGPSVVVNGGDASYEDPWKSIRMVVPAKPNVMAEFQHKFPADTAELAACRDDVLNGLQRSINNLYELGPNSPLAKAAEAVAAGVPDPSIWPVIDALQLATDRSRALLGGGVFDTTVGQYVDDERRAQLNKSIATTILRKCPSQSSQPAAQTKPKLVMKAPPTGKIGNIRPVVNVAMRDDPGASRATTSYVALVAGCAIVAGFLYYRNRK